MLGDRMHYPHTLYIYSYTVLPGVSRKDYVYIFALAFTGSADLLF